MLTEHRISYELVDGQMMEFKSKELHQDVVVPTLRLLSGRLGWEKVEAAYQNALRRSPAAAQRTPSRTPGRRCRRPPPSWAARATPSGRS